MVRIMIMILLLLIMIMRRGVSHGIAVCEDPHYAVVILWKWSFDFNL
jgi:hypothetical protein